MTIPCAPSMIAAAKPRPSAAPPASRTGTSSPIASTTAGTSVKDPCETPWPPASPPLAHDNVGSLCHDVDGHSNVLHLTDEERAGVLDTSHKGFGIAEGEQYCARVRGQSQI